MRQSTTRATVARPSDHSVPPEFERAERDHQHWQAWTLRGLLAALVLGQLLMGNREGATVAGLGLAVTMIPVLITRFSGWHVPRALELTFVLAMFLQYGSESLKLFEILTYWDKIIHPVEIFLATAVAAFLFLGYREHRRLDIPDGLAAFGAMLFGMTLGATWELIEFAFDWFGNANLQKSNADTLTDVLTNDAGAIFGALFAFWLFRHHTTEAQRLKCGEIADWLTDRLTRLFERHGFAVGIAVGLAFVAVIGLGWLMDRRPIPPPPTSSGQPATWDFSRASTSRAAPVLGEWQPEERGICRVTMDKPLPGSEKMGLLVLAPQSSYGSDGPFALTATYIVDRPALGDGTAMEAGLAFGIRDPENFYLLRASAIHDVVAIERYIHGRKRVLREERMRTRGDEARAISVHVQGDRVVASLDGRQVLQEVGLVETAGGVGLWARATARACFSDVQVRTT